MDSAPPRPDALHPRPGRRRSARLRLCAALLSVGFLAIAGVAGAQSPRIGYVDMQRLLDNAPQVIDARARLAHEFALRDQRLTADEQRLGELEARRRTDLAAAGTDEAQSLDAEINALRRSVERTRQRLREELQLRSAEEVDRAFPRINEAVADYAREQGYDLVLSSPVIYASGRLDITDAVLDRLRREFDGAAR